MKNKPKLIRNWKELAEIPNESATHILEVNVNDCNGFLHPKNPKPYNYKLSFMRQIQNQDYYLSTHSFYGHEYNHASKILRACGFNVQLDNWDKMEER